MENEIEINSNCEHSVFLWFVPYSASGVEALISGIDADHPTASFNHCFDYEITKNKKWKLHIDTGLTVLPFAEIKTRSTFELECKTGQEEHLFTPEALHLLNEINKIAFQKCVQGFNEQCTAHGLRSNWNLTPTPQHLQGFSESMASQYAVRKEHAIKNTKLNVDGLKLTQGKLTYLTLMAPFMILDEILFVNKAFNCKHNLHVFSDAMPETCYYTLKLKCIKIKTQTLQLTLEDTTYFVICLDCALQMLMDVHADTLMPSLIENGLTAEKQQKFISFASGMIKYLREECERDEVHITNLDKRYDWNALMQ